MRILIFIILILTNSYSSGGYDHGSPTGKGNLQIDLTWNPFDIIEYGQSYIVLSYGITNKIDFHTYFSRESDGTEQLYYGLMTTFFQNKHLDLSTAIGKRDRLEESHFFFPQLLYNFKLQNDYTIGGSIVNVSKNFLDNNMGITYDVSLFSPLYEKNKKSFIPYFKYFSATK